MMITIMVIMTVACNDSRCNDGCNVGLFVGSYDDNCNDDGLVFGCHDSILDGINLGLIDGSNDNFCNYFRKRISARINPSFY